MFCLGKGGNHFILCIDGTGQSYSTGVHAAFYVHALFFCLFLNRTDCDSAKFIDVHLFDNVK